MIDLPDLSDFMIGEPPSEQPAAAANGTPPAPPAEAEKPVRRRRSKAQIEADRIAEAARKAGKASAPAAATGSRAAASAAAPSAAIPAEVDAELAFLNDGKTPSPYTPQHAEAAAHALGYQSAEQRERIISAEREDKPNGYAEAPPDAPDMQVLTDEIHLLRDDLRQLASEIRKLALAVDRFREEENARYSEDVARETREAPKNPA
jgi:hypothetical protein